MVKEIDSSFNGECEKVLVCITAQSNSKRLINQGAEIADQCNGELHILHVQKGNNIFHNSDTPRLLQHLFQYGSEKGGMIHAYCDDNIPESIAAFIEKEKVTKLVLGEPPAHLKNIRKQNENQFHKILQSTKQKVQVIIVGRKDDEDKEIENKKDYNVV